MYSLKITSWHLEHSSGTWVHSHDFGATFHCSDVEVAALVQMWMLRQVCTTCAGASRLWELLVEVIIE